MTFRRARYGVYFSSHAPHLCSSHAPLFAVPFCEETALFPKFVNFAKFLAYVRRIRLPPTAPVCLLPFLRSRRVGNAPPTSITLMRTRVSALTIIPS